MTDFIAQGGANRIAVNVIRKIAGDPKRRYNAKPCQQIMNNHFKEAIFDDIAAAIMMEIYKGVNGLVIDKISGQLVPIETGPYMFWDAYNTNEKGVQFKLSYNDKDAYNHFYRALENTLNRFKDGNENTGEIISYDALYYNEKTGKLSPVYKDSNNEYKTEKRRSLFTYDKDKSDKLNETIYSPDGQKVVNDHCRGKVRKASPFYSQSIAINRDDIGDIAARYDVKLLFSWIKTQVKAEKFHDLCTVSNYLFLGYKSETIADLMHVSIDKVSNLRRDLKVLYSKYDGHLIIGNYYKSDIAAIRRYKGYRDYLKNNLNHFNKLGLYKGTGKVLKGKIRKADYKPPVYTIFDNSGLSIDIRQYMHQKALNKLYKNSPIVISRADGEKAAIRYQHKQAFNTNKHRVIAYYDTTPRTTDYSIDYIVTGDNITVINADNNTVLHTIPIKR